MPSPQVRFVHAFCLLAFVTTALAGNPATTAPALGAGPHEVGSSPFEIAPPATGALADYLKGKATAQETWYVADLLKHRDAALVPTLEIPADAANYGRHAGKRFPLALYVLYPTSRDNPRPAYVFPYPDTADNVFPHMQRPGERPIFAETGKRYPLIVYSHGYDAHGLWDLDHLKFLASHGYIVVSVFHGDGRIGFESGLPIRPLALRLALDTVLAHPDFGPAVDPERIGVSGSSFGGFTVLAAMGGKYRKDGVVERDERIKAGFGIVPFMGATMGFFPFRLKVWPFGEDYAGLRKVTVPFFAVCAEKDESVSAESVLGGAQQMRGAVSVVTLAGEGHLLSKEAWSDVRTWEVLFFNAWLRDDAAARRLLYRATTIEGGGSDAKTHQHAAGSEE